MSLIAESSPIIEKTKELCQFIAESPEYNALMGSVEAFLSNDEARLLYQSVHERSEELRNKQRAGVELGQAEIDAFKDVRGQMEQNDVIMDFMSAQDELQNVQMAVSKYVGMTLELGRIPTKEDLATADGGGCCGGGCGGGECS